MYTQFFDKSVMRGSMILSKTFNERIVVWRNQLRRVGIPHEGRVVEFKTPCKGTPVVKLWLACKCYYFKHKGHHKRKCANANPFGAKD